MHNSLNNKLESTATQAAPQAITLEELLHSRDERHALQCRLLAENEGMAVVMLTIVMPGAVKRNRLSLTIGHAAVAALTDVFDQKPTVRDLKTGFEAYLLTTLDCHKAKLTACKIEDTHPLGRLFDIDVIDYQGRPIERSSLGLPPRRCLLCEHEARYCMRSHSHTHDEVMRRIEELVDNYVQ